MILCGFFCAGKSTIGRIYAEKMGLPFYDTDRIMEARYGKPVSSVWLEIGDDAFRDVESEIVENLKPGGVIATGGGTLIRERNRESLKVLGTPIYLKASIDTLFNRVLKRGIPPSLNTENPRVHFEMLAAKRFPIFETFCEHTIVTDDRTEEEVVEDIKHFFFQETF